MSSTNSALKHPSDFDSSSWRLNLLESIRDHAIYLLDPGGRVISWNAGAERFKGYRANEVLGLHFSCFYTPEDQARGEPERALATALSEGKFEAEAWRVRKDGTRFWTSVVIEPVYEQDGSLAGFAKVTRDITAKRAAEDALKTCQQHFRMFVAGVHDYAIYMLDPEGRISSWNAGAKTIKGYDAQEIVGKNFSQFYTEDDRNRGEPQQALETATVDGKFEAEGWRVRKDGTRFWAHVKIDAIRDASGVLLGFAKVTRDITERHKAEAIEWSRLNAMGAMASTLAHALNQPLTTISNYVRGSRQILSKAAVPSEVIEALDGADKSAVRAGEIIRRAREIVSNGAAGRRPEAIDSLIEDALHHAIGHRQWGAIDRQLILDPTITNIFVDREQIQQVLVSLVRNAAEAMVGNDRGTLIVRTRRDHEDLCEISVEDNGYGIPDDVAAHLFDPFDMVAGCEIAIGLSISRTIVEAHGGRIWWRPNAHQGTVFSFTVPLSCQSNLRL